MAVSRPRQRGAGASRARRAVDRGAFTTRRFRACALFFASLALAAPSRTSSEGTDAPVSTRDSLRDVPFEVTALVGFDARNSSVTSIPTTIGGSVEWLGGFQVAFPGEVPETGQSWNDFGGWSALVGDARGERLWTLTDNYAYLLRVDVALDSRTDTMVGVRSIENATDFAILTPRDASRLRDAREAQIKNKGEEAFGDNEGAVKVARRVDVESLVSIPRRSVPTISDTTISDTMSDTIDDVTAEGGDYETGGGLLSDFAVGVEDSWELPANNLIRFARGRGGAWTDVPGAELALNACDANLGPEALVWVPRTETNEAALVTFCETPSANSTNRRDALRGFAFFAAEISDASDANDEPTRESVTVFDLVNVDDDCGLSDASVVPGGVNVLLLFHCYSYPPGSEGRFGAGTHSTQIRVARVADLVAGDGRAPSEDPKPEDVRVVEARLLARWSGAEGCPLTNMEGIHAVPSADGRDVDLVLVSDNNLQPDDPTQIARLRVVGGVDVPGDVAAALETEQAREARRIYARPRASSSASSAAIETIETIETTETTETTETETEGEPYERIAALGDAAPHATIGSISSFFAFPFSRKGSSEAESRKGSFEKADIGNRMRSRFRGVNETDDYEYVEPGFGFVDDAAAAIDRDAAFIDRLQYDPENAYAAIENERGSILAQLRAMSMLTIAATLTTSAIVAVAALAAASVARKARAGGTTEEMRPLGVHGGVAYPKPYGFSDEFEYDAV